MSSRRPRRPLTVVSLFAGCGGSSLGYQQAGFDERLAVEWDDHAAAVFRLNFPRVHLYHGDVAALTGKEALRLAGLRPGELDVLDGSPPCQGFSTAGDRKADDPRNQLFREYVRLLRALRPRALVMENVTGMIKGEMRATYLAMTAEVRAAGYRVAGAVMNAKWFGVPQARQRVIVIGVHRDLGVEPTHPEPAADAREVGVAEALGLPPGRWGAEFTSGFSRGERVDLSRAALTIMRGGIGGSGHGKLKFRLPAPPPDGPLAYLPPPQLAGRNKELADLLRPGQNAKTLTGGSHFGLQRLRGDRPAPTITKSSGLWNRYPNLIHPAGGRGLTIGELRRLAGFPDDFMFPGRWADAWARIGNSVPPPLMRAVSEHLRDKLLP